VLTLLRKKEKTPENRKIRGQAVHDKCHATGSCKNAMRASLHADALGEKRGGELALAPGHAASKLIPSNCRTPAMFVQILVICRTTQVKDDCYVCTTLY